MLKHVPQTSNVFNVYSLGEARQSIIDGVQMELAELPDVHRMSPTAIDELTKPIAKPISPATSQALQSNLPYRTAVIFSGFSITLSLLLFTISFTLFRRHWKRLFLHPQWFFASSQGRFIQILDGNEALPQIEDNSPFFYLTKYEFLALQGLAKEIYNYIVLATTPLTPLHLTFLYEHILTFQPLIILRRRHSYCIHIF